MIFTLPEQLGLLWEVITSKGHEFEIFKIPARGAFVWNIIYKDEDNKKIDVVGIMTLIDFHVLYCTATVNLHFQGAVK